MYYSYTAYSLYEYDIWYLVFTCSTWYPELRCMIPGTWYWYERSITFICSRCRRRKVSQLTEGRFFVPGTRYTSTVVRTYGMKWLYHTYDVILCVHNMRGLKRWYDTAHSSTADRAVANPATNVRGRPSSRISAVQRIYHGRF